MYQLSDEQAQSIARAMSIARMLSNSNTSLAAKGALAYRLRRRTACKIQNDCQGAPKWQTGSGKVSTLRFFGFSWCIVKG